MVETLHQQARLTEEPTMSLNIKNERVHALAKEAAQLSGKSQTAVIEEALTQFVGRLRDDDAARRQRVQWLLDDFHRRLTPGDRQAMATAIEDLYDEDGLPR
jgi:antitoxin VapB